MEVRFVDMIGFGLAMAVAAMFASRGNDVAPLVASPKAQCRSARPDAGRQISDQEQRNDQAVSDAGH